VGLGFNFPSELPPGKLFSFNLDHLFEPFNFSALVIPVFVHFPDDLSVLILFVLTFSSFLMELMNLVVEVVSDNSKVLVIHLSEVDSRFDALNILFTCEDVFVEGLELSKLFHKLLDKLNTSFNGGLIFINEFLKLVLELFNLFRRRAVSQLRSKLSFLF